MSEKERNIAESLTRACELLPDGKKEYLIGYAEGVAAIVTWERSGVSLHHTEKESRAVSPTGCPSQTRRRRDLKRTGEQESIRREKLRN